MPKICGQIRHRIRYRSDSPATARNDTFSAEPDKLQKIFRCHCIESSEARRAERHPIGRAKGETKILKRLREESILKDLGANAFFLEELANGFFVEFLETPHQSMQQIHCLLRLGAPKF